ncbi:MAG: YdbL family protein [Zavarzinia sp.]|nr:YdbL family protein [Zavarzinia sp.]
MWKPRRSSDDFAGRRRFLRHAGLAIAGAPLAAVLLKAERAEAKPLDAPRAAGLAGERYDGYAVARPGAPAEVTALIERVNAERRALYTEEAKKQGVPVEAVAEIYAAQIARSVPTGTWLLAKDGTWSQK